MLVFEACTAWCQLSLTGGHRITHLSPVQKIEDITQSIPLLQTLRVRNIMAQSLRNPAQKALNLPTLGVRAERPSNNLPKVQASPLGPKVGVFFHVFAALGLPSAHSVIACNSSVPVESLRKSAQRCLEFPFVPCCEAACPAEQPVLLQAQDFRGTPIEAWRHCQPESPIKSSQIRMCSNAALVSGNESVIIRIT